MFYRLILAILILSRYDVCSSAEDDLNLSTISLAQLGSAVPEILTAKQGIGTLEPTGKIFDYHGQRFQVRNFYFEDTQDEKDFSQLFKSYLKSLDRDEKDCNPTFKDYLKSSGREKLLPCVVNYGGGPSLMYFITRPDAKLLCFLCIRPEPIHGYDKSKYPMVSLPIKTNHFIPDTDLLEKILQKLPEFAQSKSSWMISSCTKTEITLSTGKKYQISQAFFEDPLKELPSHQTVAQFVASQKRDHPTAIGVKYDEKFIEVYYRPTFGYENHILFYLNLRRL